MSWYMGKDIRVSLNVYVFGNKFRSAATFTILPVTHSRIAWRRKKNVQVLEKIRLSVILLNYFCI